MARKPSTLSVYKPTLREQLAILGEKGYAALTGKEPGYEGRERIRNLTGLADLLDVPGIALSASDAARSLGTRQYSQAAGDLAGLALGAIPIAGPALKGAGKKVAKEGVEAATRLAAKYGAEAKGIQAFHGTNTSIDNFRPLTHFGTETAAKQRLNLKYKGEGDVLPVTLDIKNPLKVKDAYASDEASLLNAIKRGEFPQLNLKTATNEGTAAALQEAGYDGMVYNNRMEDRGKLSYVNLTPEQVTINRTAEVTPNVEDLASKYGADLPANYVPHGSPEYQANLDRLLEGNHPLVPPVLYHGTDRDIQVFDTEKRRREDAGMGADNTDTGWFGKGHYLTPKRGTAAYYAGKDIGANVMPVHASMKNPFVVQGTGGMDMDRAINAQYPDAPPAPQQGRKPSEQTAFLKSKGHDGVVALDADGYHEFVAFDSPQIKSAVGNRGTFDPNEPDITKARGGVVNSAELRYKYGIK